MVGDGKKYLLTYLRLHLKVSSVPKIPLIKVEQINHAAAGRYVRSVRKVNGKSLRWLARQMGCSAPFLSDLERGRRNWNNEKFNRALSKLK